MLNAGTYRGRAEISRFLEDQREPFEEVLAVPEEFFEQGNRLVAFVRMRFKPKGKRASGASSAWRSEARGKADAHWPVRA